MPKKTAKTISKTSPRPNRKSAGRKAVLQKALSERKPAKRQGMGHGSAGPLPRVTPPLWSDAEIEEAFRRLQVARPEPKGELLHINAFTLLVAVVLSAQATDAGVNK